jgi:hypothetical protein
LDLEVLVDEQALLVLEQMEEFPYFQVFSQRVAVLAVLLLMVLPVLHQVVLVEVH